MLLAAMSLAPVALGAERVEMLPQLEASMPESAVKLWARALRSWSAQSWQAATELALRAELWPALRRVEE